MIEYIYIVKCDGCEDEIFNFFTDARMQCDLVMSKHPIIQQIEIERNDFGECTDSTDLGTVWSWEEVMDKETDAEPAASVFTKDDLKNLSVDNDPEFDDDDFYFMNNTIAEDYSRRVSFKSKAEHNEFMKLCSEIGIITGEDLDRFMVDHKADDSNLLDKLRAYRDELGTGFKIKEAVLSEDLEYEFKPTELQKAKAEVFKLNAMQRFKQDETLPEIFALYKELAAADPEGKTSATSGFHTTAEDFLNFYRTFQKLKADREIEVDHNWDDNEKRDLGTGAASVKFKSNDVKDKLMAESIYKNSARKPIPEGMTIEELVEEMEENEDTVECTWCNDLFDKSECRKEVDLGWLCSRCEAAIKSRGETLTFRENNYWDFLDEELKPKTWICEFDGREIGTVEASTEEEAYAAMEREYPEYHYGLYDGVAIVYPADEDELDENVKEIHDLGNEYDGGYPDETPEVSDSHLKLCPECGKETFDTETGICVTCGFN